MVGVDKFNIKTQRNINPIMEVRLTSCETILKPTEKIETFQDRVWEEVCSPQICVGKIPSRTSTRQFKRSKPCCDKVNAHGRLTVQGLVVEMSQRSFIFSPIPLFDSEFSRKASVADQLQRQEQLIRKLTSDLKHEKEESKKKDAALRKYESFYREVKARSAQKAAQRQMENQQRHHKTRNSSRVIR